MSDVIDVNIYHADFEVYWQDEVELNLDMELMYIKSGEAEIQNYVETVSKPEINDYIETNAQPLVSQIVEEIAEPTVAAYIEDTVKPEINDYADSLKPELQAYVTQAGGYADNSQASATASAASAAAALTSANNAGQSATSAQSSANNAASSKNAAASSATSASNYANNSKIWAEGTDSQVQALGGTHSAKVWANSIDDDVVHKTGNETISGQKNFKYENNNIVLQSPSMIAGEESAAKFVVIMMKDKNGQNIGYVGNQKRSDGASFTTMVAYDPRGSSYGETAMGVLVKPDGTKESYCGITPPVTDNGTRIATTAFVNNFISNLTSTVGSGYVYIGNLLIQWGRENITTYGNYTVTFSKPFSSSTSYTIVKNYASSQTTAMQDYEGGFFNQTATQATTVNSVNDTSVFYWLAIGQGA